MTKLLVFGSVVLAGILAIHLTGCSTPSAGGGDAAQRIDDEGVLSGTLRIAATGEDCILDNWETDSPWVTVFSVEEDVLVLANVFELDEDLQVDLGADGSFEMSIERVVTCEDGTNSIARSTIDGVYEALDDPPTLTATGDGTACECEFSIAMSAFDIGRCVAQGGTCLLDEHCCGGHVCGSGGRCEEGDGGSDDNDGNDNGSDTDPEPKPAELTFSLINKTTVDDAFLDYLRTTDADIPDTPIQPRVGVLVGVRTGTGEELGIGLYAGDPYTQRTLEPCGEDEERLPTVDPLLTEGFSEHALVCDGQNTDVLDISVDVYVPALVSEFMVEGDGPPFLSITWPPKFWDLEADVLDGSGNVLTLHNFSPEDFPTPLSSIPCGETVNIVVEGVLTVPFTDCVSSPGSVPGWLETDEASEAAFPGRFSASLSVDDGAEA